MRLVRLTQWVTKAASVAELRQFCSGTITRALVIVVKRSLTEKINIMGQLLDLLCSILRKIGIPTRDLTSSAKALQSAIVQSRSTISTTNTTLDESIADAISQNIVDRISTTVHKVTAVSQDGARTIQTLETEIEGLVSDMPVIKYGSANARDLMSNRDCQKLAAEKYSKILDITMQSKNAASAETAAPNGFTNKTNGHAANNNSNDIMASLLGDQYETISTSKLQQAELQQQLDKATSSTYTGRQRIVSNLTTYTTERDTITTRMEELKLEMHRLATAHSTLTQKINDRTNDLQKFDQNLTGEGKEFEARLTETNKKAQAYDSVVGLVQYLEELGGILTSSTNSYTKAMAKKSPVGDEALVKFLRNMELYLVRMKNYFDSEVRMVGFLRERAVSLEQQLPSLEFEIHECTALGMTSNVSEMTKNLKDMVQNVADDRGIANALSREAENMRQDLMERCEQYLDMVRRGESKALDNAAHISVLDTIRQNASQIELPETRRYKALMASVSGIASPPIAAPSSPRKVATKGNTYDNNGINNHVYSKASEPLVEITPNTYQNDEMEIPGHVIVGAGNVGAGSTVLKNIAAIEKIVEANPVKAPVPDDKPVVKPGWGKVQSSKATTRSLRDIQKEELSMQ